MGLCKAHLPILPGSKSSAGDSQSWGLLAKGGRNAPTEAAAQPAPGCGNLAVLVLVTHLIGGFKNPLPY